VPGGYRLADPTGGNLLSRIVRHPRTNLQQNLPPLLDPESGAEGGLNLRGRCATRPCVSRALPLFAVILLRPPFANPISRAARPCSANFGHTALHSNAVISRSNCTGSTNHHWCSAEPEKAQDCDDDDDGADDVDDVVHGSTFACVKELNRVVIAIHQTLTWTVSFLARTVGTLAHVRSTASTGFRLATAPCDVRLTLPADALWTLYIGVIQGYGDDIAASGILVDNVRQLREVVPVPSPGTLPLLLLGIGLAGLARSRQLKPGVESPPVKTLWR